MFHAERVLYRQMVPKGPGMSASEIVTSAMIPAATIRGATSAGRVVCRRGTKAG